MTKTIKAGVTGASGFIGSRLSDAIDKDPYFDRAYRLSRTLKTCSGDIFFRTAPDLEDEHGDWDTPLRDLDVLVHCAGRAHITKSHENQVEETLAFDLSNHHGTIRVAKAALRAGIKKFVFISSSAVVAGDAENGAPKESFVYSCKTPYGVSKMKAEIKLAELFKQHGEAELIIFRPPLVVSHGAPGNFGAFERLANHMLINPFAGICNRRSVIVLDNLVEAIVRSCKCETDNLEIFHPMEKDYLSTAELLSAIRTASNVKTFSLSLPPAFISSLFKIISKQHLYNKMFQDFRMDGSNCVSVLGDYRLTHLKHALRS